MKDSRLDTDKIEAVLDYLTSKENRDGGFYWSATKAGSPPEIEILKDQLSPIQEVVANRSLVLLGVGQKQVPIPK